MQDRRDLLEWLATMAQQDRGTYREIRALMWRMYQCNPENRPGHSVCPSKFS